MKIIDTSLLTPATMPASATEALWIYNGLDCAVTFEVLDVISQQLDSVTRSTYEFSKSLQGPILEMNMRGVLIDQERRAEVVHLYSEKAVMLERAFQRLVTEGLGIAPINMKSPQQLAYLFYDVLKLPKVHKQGRVTTDRDALEKLSLHFFAEPLVNFILTLRDIYKTISTLKTAVDSDSRIRTSYNIAGTTTGRLSSAISDFGTGGNLQNITQKLRSIFIADPGMKMANIDLEQGDARNVAAIIYNLFGDDKYLLACESGDLHTSVSKLSWKELPWTGDLKTDKQIAEQPFYRHFSYRDMAKRLGHGTNYLGTPQTMSKHTKVPIAVVKEFQPRYFTAFPGIPRWHEHVRNTLETKGSITTLLGRRRKFFGRRTDDSTLREAVAFEPQSLTADEIDQGMLNVWRLDICQILLQVHDSILVQYPEEREDEILPKIMEALKVPIELRGGRRFSVPAEAKVGWNWGNVEYGKSGNIVGNPDGLKKYNGHDNRHRERSTKTSLLDRRFF